MSTISTDQDRICGDTFSLSTQCISDDGESVDFGTLVSSKETPKPQCFGYASANDSLQECFFTAKTKYYASQTTYSNQTSRKNRKKRKISLQHLEQEPDSSSTSFNLQDLEDKEALDLHDGKHLYAGREIFSRWVLQFVRNAS
jgi:hypothetical protein